MKWSYTEPEPGEMRRKKKFLFWPIKIMNAETRKVTWYWLETVTLLQICMEIYKPGGWIKKWVTEGVLTGENEQETTEKMQAPKEIPQDSCSGDTEDTSRYDYLR